jgi:hypothetical protein
MDPSTQSRSTSPLQRQLANLKLVSRLLGHELHSQSNAKSITFSREAVVEIQTTLDLFIEEVTRSQLGIGAPQGSTTPPTRMVGASSGG